MAINFSTGSSQSFGAKIVQFQYTTFNHIGFSNGNTYQTVTSLSITPRSSSNRILLWCGLPCSFAAGHAGQARFLRNGSTFELTGDSNRDPGHGGEEGVQSDGGANFSLMAVDSPSTTSAITYSVQMRAESNGVFRVNTSMNNYSDQNAAGYPGTYKSWMYAMEVSPN